MEKETELRKPTFWNKVWSGLGYSGIASAITLVPLFVACSFKKKNSEFFTQVNDLSHHLTIPTFITGLVYGWGQPEQRYLEEQNEKLKIDNAVLQTKAEAISGATKSWVAAEQARSAAEKTR